MNTRVQFLIIFVCSHFGDISRSDSQLINNRIIGGTATDVRDFPYQLSLEEHYFNQFRHVCGASVISKTWAVTAAHCIYKSQAARFRIRAATSFIETGGTIYNIKDIIGQPNYKLSNDDYDIAVIKVAKPGFKYSEVLKPIALAKTTPPAGTTVVVSGWGAIKTGGDVVEQLREVAVKIIDHDKCNAAYKSDGGVTPRMLCAGVTKGSKRDACGGDSGGPLVDQAKQLLVGVVSTGMDCGDRRHPGVYTDVAYLRHWVQNVTRTKNNKCTEVIRRVMIMK